MSLLPSPRTSSCPLGAAMGLQGLHGQHGAFPGAGQGVLPGRELQQEPTAVCWQHMKSPIHRMCLCVFCWGEQREGREWKGRELSYALRCRVCFQQVFFCFPKRVKTLFISPFSSSALGDISNNNITAVLLVVLCSCECRMGWIAESKGSFTPSTWWGNELMCFQVGAGERALPGCVTAASISLCWYRQPAPAQRHCPASSKHTECCLKTQPCTTPFSFCSVAPCLYTCCLMPRHVNTAWFVLAALEIAWLHPCLGASSTVCAERGQAQCWGFSLSQTTQASLDLPFSIWKTALAVFSPFVEMN